MDGQVQARPGSPPKPPLRKGGKAERNRPPKILPSRVSSLHPSLALPDREKPFRRPVCHAASHGQPLAPEMVPVRTWRSCRQGACDGADLMTDPDVAVGCRRIADAPKRSEDEPSGTTGAFREAVPDANLDFSRSGRRWGRGVAPDLRAVVPAVEDEEVESMKTLITMAILLAAPAPDHEVKDTGPPLIRSAANGQVVGPRDLGRGKGPRRGVAGAGPRGARSSRSTRRPRPRSARSTSPGRSASTRDRDTRLDVGPDQDPGRRRRRARTGFDCEGHAMAPGPAQAATRAGGRHARPADRRRPHRRRSG